MNTVKDIDCMVAILNRINMSEVDRTKLVQAVHDIELISRKHDIKAMDLIDILTGCMGVLEIARDK